MTKNLPSHAMVLELGAGTGSITESILSKLADPAQLTAVEMDSELCAILKNKFPDIKICQNDIHEILCQEDNFDFIFSGIPFAAMDKTRRQQIFHLIRERLSPGGSFVMFQYSILTRKELHTIFGNLKTELTPLNIPPAFVFTCTR
jgi:phospholipid N-methyltransferase